MITDAQCHAACKVLFGVYDADDLKNMRLALEAAERAAWRPVSEAPKGQELLLYEPAGKSGRITMPARMVIERWPTCYPREASHFQTIPLPPGDAK